MSLRTLTCGFAVALATVGLSAGAAEPVGTIVAISAISSPRLSLYSGTTVESKVKELPKESVQVPLKVSDVGEGERFLRIELDGDRYWVRKVQVDVLRAVTTGCLAAAAAPTETGGIRGANRGCAK